MRSRRAFAVGLAVALLVGTACGSSEAKLGPLTLVPPEGWLVTDREPRSIKITNGSIGDDESTRAGDATAVFDVYIESDQTVEEFRGFLRRNNVAPKIERLRVDGYEAVLVSYEKTGYIPGAEVLFVPEWDVRVMYRAAYPDAESAFVKHRDDFRKAVASIRFSETRAAQA